MGLVIFAPLFSAAFAQEPRALGEGGDLDDPPADSVLFDVVLGTDAQQIAAIREWAARASDPRPLFEALSDGTADVRLAAVLALEQLAAARPDRRPVVVTALRDRAPGEANVGVRAEMERVIAAVDPTGSLPDVTMRATPSGPKPVVDHPGRPAAYLVGIGYGGYVGGNIAYIVDEAMEPVGTEQPTNGGAITAGAALGAAVGAGTTGLLAARLDPRPAQSAALSTGMFVGGFVGHSVASTFIAPGDEARPERQQIAQLAGTMGGAGVALARAKHARSVGSNLHLDLATVVGWQTAAGFSDVATLDPQDDRQLRAGIGLGGGLAFFALAAGVGPRLHAPSAPATTLAVVDGAWLGAWTPYLFRDEPTTLQHVGGIRLGLGAAYLGSVAAAGFEAQPSWRSVGLQSLGLAAGSALGAGIPLAVGGDGPVATVVGPMLGGGAAGQLVGALIAPRYDLTRDDIYLMSTLGAWTAYQSVGWGLFAGSSEPEASTRPLGYALTAGGAGTLMTMAAGPLLDVAPPSSFQLLASGGWGTWFAGWGADLADLERSDQWLATLAGGDVAIVGTAVAEAAGFRPTWTDLGLVNGLGVLGAGAGGLVGVVFLYDREDMDPTLISVLAGSGAGLVTGAVLAALDDHGGRQALALPPVRSIGMQPTFSLRPWADEERRPGVFAELRFDEMR